MGVCVCVGVGVGVCARARACVCEWVVYSFLEVIPFSPGCLMPRAVRRTHYVA